MNQLTPRFYEAIPPSVAGAPWAYTAAVFALMSITVLCLEWLWRLTWSLTVEDRRGPTHPLTLGRVIIWLLLANVLLGCVGDLLLLMLWPEVSPVTRLTLSSLDRMLDSLCLPFFFMAWLIGLLGGPMIDWQLARLPIPVNVWPTLAQIRRPLFIGGLVLGISMTVTLLR